MAAIPIHCTAFHSNCKTAVYHWTHLVVIFSVLQLRCVEIVLIFRQRLSWRSTESIFVVLERQ